VIETEYSETVQLPLFNHTSTSIPRRRSRFSPPLWGPGRRRAPGARGRRQIDVARFFTVFAIMLLAAKFAGEAFERLGNRP